MKRNANIEWPETVIKISSVIDKRLSTLLSSARHCFYLFYVQNNFARFLMFNGLVLRLENLQLLQINIKI